MKSELDREGRKEKLGMAQRKGFMISLNMHETFIENPQYIVYFHKTEHKISRTKFLPSRHS